jgi:hypothetical protein
MGRGCGFVARTFAAQRLNKLCDARIVFVRKRLVRTARLLCCVSLEAAMHKRKSRNYFEETFSNKGFDFSGEQTQHSRRCIDAMIFSAGLNDLVH